MDRLAKGDSGTEIEPTEQLLAAMSIRARLVGDDVQVRRRLNSYISRNTDLHSVRTIDEVLRQLRGSHYAELIQTGEVSRPVSLTRAQNDLISAALGAFRGIDVGGVGVVEPRSRVPSGAAHGIIGELSQIIRGPEGLKGLPQLKHPILLEPYVESLLQAGGDPRPQDWYRISESLDEALIVATTFELGSFTNRSGINQWMKKRLALVRNRDQLNNLLATVGTATGLTRRPDEFLDTVADSLKELDAATLGIGDGEPGTNAIAAREAAAKMVLLAATIRQMDEGPQSGRWSSEHFEAIGAFVGRTLSAFNGIPGYQLKSRDLFFLEQWARKFQPGRVPDDRPLRQFTRGHPHAVEIDELLRFVRSDSGAVRQTLAKMSDGTKQSLATLLAAHQAQRTPEAGSKAELTLNGRFSAATLEEAFRNAAEALLASHPAYWRELDGAHGLAELRQDFSLLTARNLTMEQMEKILDPIRPASPPEAVREKLRRLARSEPVFLALARKSKADRARVNANAAGGNPQPDLFAPEAALQRALVEPARRERKLAGIFWSGPASPTPWLGRELAWEKTPLEVEVASVVDHLVEAERLFQRGIDEHFGTGFAPSQEPDRDDGQDRAGRLQKLANARQHLIEAQSVYRGLILPTPRPLAYDVNPGYEEDESYVPRRGNIVFRSPVAAALPLAELRKWHTGSAAPEWPLRAHVADRLQQIRTRIAVIDKGGDAIGFTFPGQPALGFADVKIGGDPKVFQDQNLKGYVLHVAQLRDQLAAMNAAVFDNLRVANVLRQAELGWRAWDHKVVARAHTLAARTIELEAARRDVDRFAYLSDSKKFEAAGAHFSMQAYEQLAQSSFHTGEAQLIRLNVSGYDVWLKEKQAAMLLAVVPYHTVELELQKKLFEKARDHVNKKLGSLPAMFEIYGREREKDVWGFIKSTVKIVATVAGPALGVPNLSAIVSTGFNMIDAAKSGDFAEFGSSVLAMYENVEGESLLASAEKTPLGQKAKKLFEDVQKQYKTSGVNEVLAKAVPGETLRNAGFSPEMSLLEMAKRAREIKDGGGRPGVPDLDTFLRSAAAESGLRLARTGIDVAEGALKERLDKSLQELAKSLNRAAPAAKLDGLTRSRTVTIAGESIKAYLAGDAQMAGYLEGHLREHLALELSRGLTAHSPAFAKLKAVRDALDAKVTEAEQATRLVSLTKLLGDVLANRVASDPADAKLRLGISNALAEAGSAADARRLIAIALAGLQGADLSQIQDADLQAAIDGRTSLRALSKIHEELMPALLKGELSIPLRASAVTAGLGEGPLNDAAVQGGQLTSVVKEDVEAILRQIESEQVIADRLSKLPAAAREARDKVNGVISAVRVARGKLDAVRSAPLDWLRPLCDGLVKNAIIGDTNNPTPPLAGDGEVHDRVWAAMTSLTAISHAPTAAFSVEASQAFNVTEAGPIIEISRKWEAELLDRLKEEKYLVSGDKVADLRATYFEVKEKYTSIRLGADAKELLQNLPAAQLPTQLGAAIAAFEKHVAAADEMVRVQIMEGMGPLQAEIDVMVRNYRDGEGLQAFNDSMEKLRTQLREKLDAGEKELNAASASLGDLSALAHNPAFRQAIDIWASRKFTLIAAEQDMLAALAELVRRANEREESFRMEPANGAAAAGANWKIVAGWEQNGRPLSELGKQMKSGRYPESHRDEANRLWVAFPPKDGSPSQLVYAEDGVEIGAMNDLREELKWLRDNEGRDLRDHELRRVSSVFARLDAAVELRDQAKAELKAEVAPLSQEIASIEELKPDRELRYNAYVAVREAFGLLDKASMGVGADGARPEALQRMIERISVDPSLGEAGVYAAIRDLIRSGLEEKIENRALQRELLATTSAAMANGLFAARERSMTHVRDLESLAAGIDLELAKRRVDQLAAELAAEQAMLESDQAMLQQAALQIDLASIDRAELEMNVGGTPGVNSLRALQRDIWRAAKDIWQYSDMYADLKDVPLVLPGGASWTPAAIDRFLQSAWQLDQDLNRHRKAIHFGQNGFLEISAGMLRVGEEANEVPAPGDIHHQRRVRLFIVDAAVKPGEQPGRINWSFYSVGRAGDAALAKLQAGSSAHSLSRDSQRTHVILHDAGGSQRSALAGVMIRRPQKLSQGRTFQQEWGAWRQANPAKVDQDVALSAKVCSIARASPGVLYVAENGVKRPRLVFWNERNEKGELILPHQPINDSMAHEFLFASAQGAAPPPPPQFASFYLTPTYGVYDLYFEREVIDFLTVGRDSNEPVLELTLQFYARP